MAAAWMLGALLSYTAVAAAGFAPATSKER